MRGLRPDALDMLAILHRETEWVCDDAEACAAQPDVPDELERELLARRLVTQIHQPCGGQHLHITPLGRLALR